MNQIDPESASESFNQMKIFALLPPSAGLFSRVHERDLIEEIVEVKAVLHFYLYRLRLLLFISIIVPVIAVIVVTTIVITIVTTIINRLFRLGGWCLRPENRRKNE